MYQPTMFLRVEIMSWRYWITPNQLVISCACKLSSLIITNLGIALLYETNYHDMFTWISHGCGFNIWMPDWAEIGVFIILIFFHINAWLIVQQKLFCTGKDRSFDYISVTPPYTSVNYSTLMEQLGKSTLVGENCFIVRCIPMENAFFSPSCCVITNNDNLLAGGVSPQNLNGGFLWTSCKGASS